MSNPGSAPIRWFRSTAPYINAHRGRTFVLAIAGEVVSAATFAGLIHDIALLNSLGVRLVIVHGSRRQIDEQLNDAGVASRFHRYLRVTDGAILPHVKAAASAVRTQIEAQLSMGLPNSPMQGAQIRVCSGNYVTARPIGVVDGVDHEFTGVVRRIDSAGVRQQLDHGTIVLLSPLGYSPTGEVFNLAMEDVAVRCAAELEADKLILFGEAQGLLNAHGELLRQVAIGDTHRIESTLEADQRRLLHTACMACEAGVPRVHIISYLEDGALLEELFTHDGSGTLVTMQDYERSRRATIDDVGGILELIEPLEQTGVLVKRSRELLETEIGRFRLLERDGRILACAALYPFPDETCGEIACIVSHPQYRGAQRGEKLLRELENEARQQQLDRVFVLTTQTSHWFQEQGFEETDREALPAQRQLLYNLQRNSKVLFKPLGGAGK